MFLRACLFLTFLWLIAVLPVPAQNVLPANTSSSSGQPLVGAAAHPLQLSAGDLLELKTLGTSDPDLSPRLRVSEQGAIAVPYAGVLSVSGMTADEASRAIEARFREQDVLKDPHVSVTVLEYATQGVTVAGEVKNPGVYPLLGSHALLDLVSAAGGVTPNGGKAVTITHRDDADHPQVVNLASKAGSISTFNVDVHPGDTIVVSHAGIVYVLGDVAKPGGFLIENSDRLTVLQAISLAQGTNRTASLDHTKLIRRNGGAREELPVPLKQILADKVADQMLEDGDILFVPGSAAKNALRDMESILPSAAGAAIYHVP
jgi:polysaccharide export outer membrane protein